MTRRGLRVIWRGITGAGKLKIPDDVSLLNLLMGRRD